VGLALAALCVTATPARASVATYFSNDSGIDDVSVSAPPRPEIIVSISGHETPQVLKIGDTPLALVVADVNHDGVVDLTALFPHRHLVVWLNSGSHGLWRLRPQTVPRSRRRTASGSPLLRVLLITRTGHDRRGAPAGQVSSWPTPMAPYDPPIAGTLPTIARFDLPFTERIPSNERAGRQTSRAPPAALVS
jgi:hypothetical protein